MPVATLESYLYSFVFVHLILDHGSRVLPLKDIDVGRLVRAYSWSTLEMR
jgi:hypothetical protein